jgi:hypothetical protein
MAKIGYFRKRRKNFSLCRRPPGTGKSSLVWNWAYCHACTSDETILWLHLPKLVKLPKLVLIEGTKGTIYECDEESISNVLKCEK